MDPFDQFCAALPEFLFPLCVIAIVLGTLWGVNWFLLRRHREMGEGRRFSRRIVMLVLLVVGTVVILLVFPIPENSRGQLVTLLGLILSATIALASTTFVANAMAGLMLRTLQSFRPGDFVRIGEHFGRVTERGLFHTEIQTEDRDLMTLPNLYLVSNPVKVVRYSGTIVSATVSLGYDLHHQQVRSVLLEAAGDAGLDEPYVQILDLGDYAVTYLIAGMLTEVKQLLAARSNLRSQVLDKLHGSGIEIASPALMTQRRLKTGEQILPPDTASVSEPTTVATDQVPQELIFDKAEEAERLEQLRIAHDQLVAEIEELKQSLEKSEPADRTRLENELASRRERAEAIARKLESAEG